jgi:sec-independent protein translocase protein TatC
MRVDGKMGFFEHLAELRWRLLRIILAVIAGMGVSLAFTPQLLKLILEPYGNRLKVIGPTEGIANYLRIGGMAGVTMVMPYILIELWGFISPALHPREKRYAFIVIPSALLLFLAGAAFAWFVMIPAAVRFLAGFDLGVFQTEWTSENYIPFVTSLLFWIGICFELPLAVFFLAKLGIVGPRLLLKGWRYAVVFICVVSAAITPTVDPFNMMLVALPMVGLYFLGVLLAFLARPGAHKRAVRSARSAG